MYARKVCAVIIAITLIFGSFSFSFGADEVSTASSNTTAFTDLSGHWAAGAINKWAGYGIISGSEGLFRPNDPITRGELAVILDNMMDYQVKASNKFTDLQSGKFYTDAVLKANAAGIIKGDGATVRPTDKITREEAAVMLSRAFAVKEASSGSTFADAAGISSWAKGAVYGMEAKGYISGYNGKFEPKADITRAAVITIIDNIVKAYYTTAGTYSDNVAGTAVIKVTGVTLKGVTVSENLIIAEGVADGDATLDSVTVKGDTVIRGGGENSIHIIGSSSLSTVTIEKVDGKIRIVVDGTTVQEVDIEEGNEIILEGNFGTVINDVPGARIIAAAGSSINKIVADVKTDVSGTGTVKEAEFKAGAGGSSITTPNTKITVDAGATGVTGGGGAPIAPGTTAENNSKGDDLTKPSTGGNDGGITPLSPTLSLDESSVRIGGNPVTKSGDYFEIDIDWTSGTALSARVTGANFEPDTIYPMKVIAKKTNGSYEVSFPYNVKGSSMNVTNKEITHLNLRDNLTGANLMDDVNDMIKVWLKNAEVGDTILVNIQNGNTVLFSLNLKVVDN